VKTDKRIELKNKRTKGVESEQKGSSLRLTFVDLLLYFFQGRGTPSIVN
jgi:hypothetical protein